MGHVEEVGLILQFLQCREHLPPPPLQACRANDNSSNATIISVLAVRLSRSSSCCCQRFLLLLITLGTSPLANLGNLKDVWFYPILNFGLFWAVLLQMSVFYPTRNFRQFWADPTCSAVRSTFLAEEEAQNVEISPHPKFLSFLGSLPGHPFDLPKCH